MGEKETMTAAEAAAGGNAGDRGISSPTGGTSDRGISSPMGGSSDRDIVEYQDGDDMTRRQRRVTT